MSIQDWIVRNGVEKIKAILFLFLQGVPLKPQDKNVGHFWKYRGLDQKSFHCSWKDSLLWWSSPHWELIDSNPSCLVKWHCSSTETCPKLTRQMLLPKATGSSGAVWSSRTNQSKHKADFHQGFLLLFDSAMHTHKLTVDEQRHLSENHKWRGTKEMTSKVSRPGDGGS